MSNTEVAGTYKGLSATNNCCTMRVTPACGGGICITQYFNGCPFACNYGCKCGSFYLAEANYSFDVANGQCSSECGKKQWAKEQSVAPASQEMTS